MVDTTASMRAGADLPYGRQWIDDDDVAAVVDVLRGDMLTTGPAVERFESALGAVLGGVPVAAVSSGTAALHAAYAACGLGPGDDLVTTPLTFVATAATALHLGATVRFVDVVDDTLTIDPDAVAAALTPRTRIVAAVDFAGHPCELDPLLATAGSAGVTLVEDAAHALGSSYRGRPVGSIAPLTTFSFHPVKTITTGEGGAVASTDPALTEAVRRFRNHGLVRDPDALLLPDEGAWHQEVHHAGLNYRLPDLLAALGTSQLARLPAFVHRRTELVARYQAGLAGVDGVRLPQQHPDVEVAWHLYAVRIRDGRRREVFERLRERGVGVQVHYLPVHRHPLFAELGYRRGMCPVAEDAYEELLSLPLFPALTDAQQDRAIAELRSALGA